jgi:hypothetical protein
MSGMAPPHLRARLSVRRRLHQRRPDRRHDLAVKSKGVDVVNMSIGGLRRSTTVNNARAIPIAV